MLKYWPQCLMLAWPPDVSKPGCPYLRNRVIVMVIMVPGSWSCWKNVRGQHILAVTW